MAEVTGHTIEDVQVRGWDVQLYYPDGLPFITASVTDSDVTVFVSFDAEFPYGWEQQPWPKLVAAARKIALQRVGEKIAEQSQARRRKWRQRQLGR